MCCAFTYPTLTIWRLASPLVTRAVIHVALGYVYGLLLQTENGGAVHATLHMT